MVQPTLNVISHQVKKNEKNICLSDRLFLYF